MKNLALAGALALALAACAAITPDQQACIITGLTAGGLEEMDVAQVQALAAECGVTVDVLVQAVNDQVAE